jgi:hypothetical protein
MPASVDDTATITSGLNFRSRIQIRLVGCIQSIEPVPAPFTGWLYI